MVVLFQKRTACLFPRSLPVAGSKPDDKAAAISAETLRAADALRRALTQVQRRLRALRADHDVNVSKLIILGRLHQAEAPLTATDLAQMERLQP